MIVGLGEKLIKPLLFFYFIWPMISKAVFDPELKEPAEDETPAEPTDWSWTIAKWVFIASLMATFFLLMIFTRQESMLYVPSQPI
jgi:hypothetical protein